jgi:glutathione S-transferase
MPACRAAGRAVGEYMLVLETFGPQWGLTDPSPFVTKAVVLLEMSGLDYETKPGDPRKTPKGKLPVLHDNGTVVPDTTFIRQHLEQVHGIDFDRGLNDKQKAVGWSVAKTLEDNLYWAVVHERWTIEENFDKGPRQFFTVVPAPLRPLIIWMVRRQVNRDLWGHGMSRHSADEILSLGKSSLDAVAAILGEQSYLMGDDPCGADACVYAFVSNVLCDHFDSTLRQAAIEHPNLVAYSKRMEERYFVDFIT